MIQPLHGDLVCCAPLKMWIGRIHYRECVKLSEIGSKRSLALGETVGDLRAKDQVGGAQTSSWARILEDA